MVQPSNWPSAQLVSDGTQILAPANLIQPQLSEFVDTCTLNIGHLSPSPVRTFAPSMCYPALIHCVLCCPYTLSSLAFIHCVLLPVYMCSLALLHCVHLPLYIVFSWSYTLCSLALIYCVRLPLNIVFSCHYILCSLALIPCVLFILYIVFSIAK